MKTKTRICFLFVLRPVVKSNKDLSLAGAVQLLITTEQNSVLSGWPQKTRV